MSQALKVFLDPLIRRHPRDLLFRLMTGAELSVSFQRAIVHGRTGAPKAHVEGIGKGDIRGQVRFVENLFKVAA